ncbi:MAG: DJ-1 family glyoxalase III [Lachnospiraceae bacterium]
MSRVGIFLADGFEEIEGLTVVDILRRAGIDISMISINGKKKVTGAHGIALDTDEDIAQCDLDGLDMLVLPGGMPGTTNLAACEKLTEALKKADQEKRGIAAICAAPSVLGDLGFLKGKKAVCYPGLESRLTGAEVLAVPVVTDGHITTSRGMGTAIAFALELTRRMKDEETAKQVGRSIIYNV